MLYQVLTLQSKGRRLDKDTRLRKDNGTKPKSAVRGLAALWKNCVNACNIDFPLSLLLGFCLLWGTKHYSLFVRFVVRDLPFVWFPTPVFLRICLPFPACFLIRVCLRNGLLLLLLCKLLAAYSCKFSRTSTVSYYDNNPRYWPVPWLKLIQNVIHILKLYGALERTFWECYKFKSCLSRVIAIHNA